MLARGKWVSGHANPGAPEVKTGNKQPPIIIAVFPCAMRRISFTHLLQLVEMFRGALLSRFGHDIACRGTFSAALVGPHSLLFLALRLCLLRLGATIVALTADLPVSLVAQRLGSCSCAFFGASLSTTHTHTIIRHLSALQIRPLLVAFAIDPLHMPPLVELQILNGSAVQTPPPPPSQPYPKSLPDHALVRHARSLFFTSGTTSAQLPVSVAARAHCTNVDALAHAWALGPRDVVALCSAPTFDPCIVEMFAALRAGASLAIPSEVCPLSMCGGESGGHGRRNAYWAGHKASLSPPSRLALRSISRFACRHHCA